MESLFLYFLSFEFFRKLRTKIQKSVKRGQVNETIVRKRNFCETHPLKCQRVLILHHKLYYHRAIIAIAEKNENRIDTPSYYFCWRK